MAIGLIALHDFTFDGVSHKQGDYFETPPIVAAALTWQKKARFATAEDRSPTSRTRRTYRRRDMVAEETVALTPESDD